MNWQPNLSTYFLPVFVRKHFQNRAELLYDDLKKNVYSSKLIPLKYPKTCIKQRRREVQTRNPHWYSVLYWQNTPHKITRNGLRKQEKKCIDRGCIENAILQII